VNACHHWISVAAKVGVVLNDNVVANASPISDFFILESSKISKILCSVSTGRSPDSVEYNYYWLRIDENLRYLTLHVFRVVRDRLSFFGDNQELTYTGRLAQTGEPVVRNLGMLLGGVANPGHRLSVWQRPHRR